MSIYNFHSTKKKNPFVRAIHSAKIHTYENIHNEKETSTKIPEFTFSKSNTNEIKYNFEENKNIETDIEKTRNNKKEKHSHSHCFQETTSRIDLFLMQDDRGSVEEIYNPLLEIISHKAPLPNFNLKKKRKKESFTLNNYFHNEDKNIVDINKQLIQNLNYEMELMNSKPTSFIPFNKNHNDNIQQISTKLIKKSQNEEKKMERIYEISPLIYEKLNQTKKRLPYLFKKIQNKEPQRNKKKLNSINLKDVLILHNSTVRRSVTQFKVKNHSFRQSLKLKNRPVYSTYKDRYHRVTTNSNIYNKTTNLNEVYL